MDDECILTQVKKLLEIEDDVNEFDTDIKSHINSAFFTLYQLGVGPSVPFFIDDTTVWSSFETSIPKSLILDYLYLKTKIVFDPPASSTVGEAYKERITELEFRMNVYTDNGGGEVNG